MKYAIHMNPVTENKSAVKKILKRIMGPGQGNVINDLINSGGVVASDLDKNDAEEILLRLRESEVVVEMRELRTPEDPSHTVNLNDFFNFKVEHERLTLTVQTPMGLQVTLSEPNQSLLLTDNHGNKIMMDANGISIESAKDLILKASGELKVEALNIDINSQANLKLDGGAGAELSSSAITSIKGSMVQIN